MKSIFLALCTTCALAGCATNASQGSSSQVHENADPVFSAPTDEGSSSSFSCVNDPQCD